MNYFFYLLLLGLSIQKQESIVDQKYFLNKNDQLQIDLDIFLPPELFLNELSCLHSPGVTAIVPKTHIKTSLQDKANQNILEYFINQSNYQNIIGFLYRDPETRMWMVIKKKINEFKFTIENEIFQMASADLECHHLAMDSKNFYVTCLSPEDKTFQICEKNYLNNSIYFCRELDFDLQQESDFSRLVSKISFSQVGGKKLFAFYLITLFGEPKNFFYLFDGEKHSKITLEDNYSIIKLKISKFNPSNLNATLLVHIENNGQNFLKFYLVDNLILNNNDKNTVIEKNIDNFIFEDNNLIFVTK